MEAGTYRTHTFSTSRPRHGAFWKRLVISKSHIHTIRIIYVFNRITQIFSYDDIASAPIANFILVIYSNQTALSVCYLNGGCPSLICASIYLTITGPTPSPRDSHVDVVYKKSMYIYGGSTGRLVRTFPYISLIALSMLLIVSSTFAIIDCLR